MAKRTSDESESKAVAKGEPIHLKFRPRALKDVLGQGPVVKSLEALLKGNAIPHCFLFVGPAGTGKTTLARICAERLDIDPRGIIEVDAAKKTGVDDMRELTDGLRYQGFGEFPNKGIILNECHRLSGNAWDSLLMSTEEPPSHAYFFFTTTDPAKIPKAILTRCTAYNLAPLRNDDLMDILEDVCKEEGYEPVKGVLQAVASAADGSGRAALTMLAKVHACDDLDEARQLLQTAVDNVEVIELARALVAGKLGWSEMSAILKSLDAQGVAPEGIRLMIVNYLNACLIGAKSDKQVPRLLDMLECFMKPATGSEKMAPLLIAFGKHLFP